MRRTWRVTSHLIRASACLCLTLADQQALSDFEAQLDAAIDTLKDMGESGRVGLSYGLGRATYNKVIVPDLLGPQPRRFPAVGALNMDAEDIRALVVLLGRRAGQRLLSQHPNSKLTQDWLASEFRAPLLWPASQGVQHAPYPPSLSCLPLRIGREKEKEKSAAASASRRRNKSPTRLMPPAPVGPGQSAAPVRRTLTRVFWLVLETELLGS